jgi:hypothetical protein
MGNDKPASVYESSLLGRITGDALSWFQSGTRLQHKDATATLRQSGLTRRGSFQDSSRSIESTYVKTVASL